MSEGKPKKVEYLYLANGRVIRLSNDTTDCNLFELWLAEEQSY